VKPYQDRISEEINKARNPPAETGIPSDNSRNSTPSQMKRGSPNYKGAKGKSTMASNYYAARSKFPPALTPSSAL